MARRGERSHANADHVRNTGLHRARAGRERGRGSDRDGGCLQPRRDSVLPPDGPAAVRGRECPFRYSSGRGYAGTPAAFARAVARSRFGNNCRPLPGTRAGARYQSAGALAEDLERWLEGRPILARHTGVFARGRKWMRRNPTTTVLVASLIALGSVIGVMFWEKESPHPMPADIAAIPYKSIAVLPFDNLSADPDNAFFTDGVQDEILNHLAKIADFKVISRTSVMQYKSGVKRNVRQIANALGVAHVVEGSVQRVANRVRVSAQLIDARTDTHLWVDSYDRPLDDVFAIQTDIAKAIAGPASGEALTGGEICD